MVLDKILMHKYNFAKQNIEEGEKFNEFYPEDKIELPQQERPFQCEFCKERSFKTNASCHSHYRSCQAKFNDEKNKEENMKVEKTEGFRPLKIRGPKTSEIKPVKVFAAEIIKQNDVVKKEK